MKNLDIKNELRQIRYWLNMLYSAAERNQAEESKARKKQ